MQYYKIKEFKPDFKPRLTDPDYIFKDCESNATFILSEIFHSLIGNQIELPCAENSLAVIRRSFLADRYGIVSKKFVKYQHLVALRDRLTVTPYKIPYFTDTLANRMFQNVNLEELFKVLKIPFYSNGTKLKKSLVQNFLMSHISSNLDTGLLHNNEVIMPQNIAAPSFDFERSENFWPFHHNTRKEESSRGIHPRNIEYLKNKFPEIIEKFLDNIRTLRSNPNFRDMCDFTYLAGFINRLGYIDINNDIAELSEATYTNYREKFDSLADSFTR